MSVGGLGTVGGGVFSALGGICGEGAWSVALVADLVRERSLDVFISETVTVAIGNRLIFDCCLLYTSPSPRDRG